MRNYIFQEFFSAAEAFVVSLKIKRDVALKTHTN